jgi:predicted Zn-dependent peptidase
MTSTLLSSDTMQVHRLENGLTVCMERLPYLHSCSVGIWIKTGSAYEVVEEAGVAHFLEHLFFKGTKSRTARQLAEVIESKGGQLNAFTSRGYTCLYAKVLDRYVHTAIEILADLVKNCTLIDWEKERNVILEEIASIEDSPEEQIHDLFAEFHWPDHPLGRPVSGYTHSVAKLTRDDVERFYRTWYRPESMCFSIAGNFDDEAIFAQVEREFSGILGEGVELNLEAPTFKAGATLLNRDIGQAHICLAFPAPSLKDPRRYAGEVVSSILGGGSTSWLFERIREEEGLAYSIYTYHSFYPQTGVLGVYAAVAPQNHAKTLDLTFEAFRKMRDEGVTPEDLDMNKEQIKGNMLMALESTFTRMSRMAKCMMYYGRIVPVDEIIANVDTVTAQEVRDFAAEYFQADKCALMTLAPEAETTKAAIAL